MTGQPLRSIHANDVQGFCPACGHGVLMLGEGGHVTCTLIDCPNPSAADEVLRHAHLTECEHAAGQRQAEAAIARVRAWADQLDTMGNGTSIEADSIRRAAAKGIRAALDQPAPTAATQETDGWTQQDDGTWTLPIEGGTVIFTCRSTPEARARFAAEWKRRHNPEREGADTPRLSVRLAWLGTAKEALLEAEQQQLAEAAGLSRADEDEAADVYEEMLRRVESSGPRLVPPGVSNPHTGAGFASSTNWTTVEPAGLPAWIRNGVHDLRFSWQPSEHCGRLSPQLFTSPPTECVLRPGYQGSHADDRGSRWRPTPEPARDGLREQVTAAVSPILEEWPEHNRIDEHEHVTRAITDAVLAVFAPKEGRQ